MDRTKLSKESFDFCSLSPGLKAMLTLKLLKGICGKNVALINPPASNPETKMMKEKTMATDTTRYFIVNANALPYTLYFM